LGGNVVTSSSQPKNLTIIMIPNPYNSSPPGTVSVGSSAALYASIYAPQSAVTMSGTGDIYGTVIGASVTMSGTSAIYYDLNMDSGSVGLVK
jgi:hypothetical protein